MPPLARTGSRPTFGRPANKFLSRGCFGEKGEVWCFCNTEPRVEAKRAVTRKESSPNLGREFYSCGNWQEPKCEFFLWVDESAQKGRQNITPPPVDATNTTPRPSSSTSRPLANPPRPTTPAPASPSKRRRSPPPSSSSSSQRPLPPSERLDDIDFDSFPTGLSDDEGEDDIEDPDTEPESGVRRSDGGSPTKKAKFTSFGGGGVNAKLGPSTPTRGETGYTAIKNDPESPFHSIKRNLFGGDSSPPPTSSPLQPAPHSNEPVDSLTALTSHFDHLPTLLQSVKKDRERDGRLIEVGKKKEELWKNKAGKLNEENEALKRENGGLREKVRRLEGEIQELRTRRR